MPRSSKRPTSPEHREAVRLALKACHIPFGTLLIGGLLLACIASALSQVFALGPQ